MLKHKLEWLANEAYTMKRGSLLYQRMLVIAGVAALGAKAQGSQVQTTNFEIDVVITPDTFETSGGTVLFTTTGVGYDQALSPSIAADLAGDSAYPLPVQSTAPLIPEVSDYDFLSEPATDFLQDYVVLGSVVSAPSAQNVFMDVANALVAAGGPGYSLTAPLSGSATNTYTQTFVLSVSEPEPWTGDIAIGVFDQNVVEQAAATPEPKTLAWLSAGLAMIIIFARRLDRQRAAGQARWRREPPRCPGPCVS